MNTLMLKKSLFAIYSALAIVGMSYAQEVTPAISGVVAAGTKIELIKDGLKGTEGPVTLPDGSLIFTETQDNRISRIYPDGSISLWLANSNGANGLGFYNGDLYAVQVVDNRVGIIYPEAHKKTLAENYQGEKFGRTNDLVVSSKGVVYFTDSGANGPVPTWLGPVGKPAVYRVAVNGALSRVSNDIERPNGIQLSPDEKVLYVANTSGEYVLAFDLSEDGKIGAKRNFAKLAGWGKADNGTFTSGADGLAVDAAGRLFVATRAGIEVFSASGEALGIIALPKAPQNLAFAGTNKSVLYVVGRGAAYRIQTLTTGFSGRAK